MGRELRTQARLSERTLVTRADIGNTVYGTEVHSVNGKVGHVVLSAEDVEALPSDTPIPSLDGYATEEWVQEQGYATLADIPPEKFLFVNMTVENESYVLDHTYGEIIQAIDDGIYPIIVDADGKSTLYPLTYKTASGLMFSTTQGSANWTIQLTSSLVNKVNTKLATKAEIPTVPTDVSAFNNDAGYLTEHQDISGKADKSEIPTKTSELTNDSGFLTQHQDLTPYALKSDIPVVPTNVSAFNNDAGYLTQHQDLSSYALKSTVYTKTQIDTALSEKSDKATTLSGYGIADAYTKTEVNNLVEGSGVTSVNGQTGTVTITASDLGAMTGMTILSYGHSTWSDFIEAYNANRIVYCKASTAANPASGEQRRMAFLAYFETNFAEFQYYRSVSSHTDAQQGDQVIIYQLRQNSTWTVTTRPASSRVVAGSGLSSAYASDTLTLSLDTDNQNKIDTLWNDYQSRA